MNGNVTDELLLQILKNIQDKLEEHDRRFDRLLSDVEAHLSTMKTDLATVVGIVSHTQGDLDVLARRIDRIERRLDLVDPRTP